MTHSQRKQCFTLGQSADILNRLHAKLQDYGFETHLTQFQKSLCSAKRPHSYIIDYQGKIYKCVSAVGDDRFYIGNIKDQKFMLDMKSSQIVELERYDKECKKCSYLPFCKGGCMYRSMVDKGDIAKKICLKEFYTKELIFKLKYNYLDYKNKLRITKNVIK